MFNNSGNKNRQHVMLAGALCISVSLITGCDIELPNGEFYLPAKETHNITETVNSEIEPTETVNTIETDKAFETVSTTETDETVETTETLPNEEKEPDTYTVFDAPPENSADSLEKLDSLGLDEYDIRLKYIKAFVTGDIKALENICMVDEGMYDCYKTLKLSKWLAWTEEDPVYMFKSVRFAFIPSESDMECFTPSKLYDYIISEGMDSASMISLRDWYDNNVTSEAAGVLRSLIENYIITDIPTTNDMDPGMRWQLTCFITEYGAGDKGFTFDEMQRYAEKHFGIIDFIPDDSHLWDGVYTCLGHGGSHQYLNIVEDEYDVWGNNIITVEYYADKSKTIKSHVYRYVMIKNEDGWMFVSSERIKIGEYEPCGYSM